MLMIYGRHLGFHGVAYRLCHCYPRRLHWSLWIPSKATECQIPISFSLQTLIETGGYNHSGAHSILYGRNKIRNSWDALIPPTEVLHILFLTNNRESNLSLLTNRGTPCRSPLWPTFEHLQNDLAKQSIRKKRCPPPYRSSSSCCINSVIPQNASE